MRDFGLPHFLERFSFKNPKKIDQDKSNTSVIGHKHYVSYGPRGMPVKSLTRTNCSEEEIFIFNYLEKKRKQSVLSKSTDDGSDDGENLKAGDVDDDEFEDYLNGFFGKKGFKADKLKGIDADDEELNFMKEIEGAFASDTKKIKGKSKKVKSDKEDNMEDIDADWGDDDDDKAHFSGSDLSDDEDGSIDLNEIQEEYNDDDQSISLDEDIDDFNDELDQNSDSDIDDNDDEPKHKKSKNDMNERNFVKKLKHSDGKLMLKLFQTIIINIFF